ncbi:MAG: hypothetical protein JNK04_26550, partial [Myxococcales bacterium]|nr:hypothetical protein [Myxococcales bacterium]
MMSLRRLRASLVLTAITLGLGLTTVNADAAPLRRNPKGQWQSGSKTWRVAQGAPAAPKRSTVASLVQRAQAMFDDQKYEESIQTLSGVVVRSDATKEERIEAHKLLAFNHIALGNTEAADALIRAIYVTDESFELPKNESPKFREFFEKTKKAWEAEGKPGQATGEKPAEKPIIVKHTPAAQVEKGTVVSIEGTVEDPDVRVEKVELFYRTGAKGKFVELSLAYSMGGFRGKIPAAAVEPPLVEYYVLALDKAGLPVATRGDADTPLRLV